MSRRSTCRTRLVLGAFKRHRTDEFETVRVRVDVPRDLYWFRGHFEDNPVLPAVVQLNEVLRITGQLWRELERLTRISSAKFRKPIRPDDRLLLGFRRRLDSNQVAFEFLRKEECCSSGVLEFSPAGATSE